MNRSYNLLLFDLDGTISDPLIGIGRSLNFALTAFGFEERPLEVSGNSLVLRLIRRLPLSLVLLRKS